jgi:hypothetical protein
MLEAVHAQEDRRSAEAKAKEVVKKVEAMRLAKASRVGRGEGQRDRDLLRLPEQPLAADQKPIARSNASSARSVDEPAWSACFPMVTRR